MNRDKRETGVPVDETTPAPSRPATIDDLYRSNAKKAELVHGRIVEMAPSGDLHGSSSGSVYASLRTYVARTGAGRAYPDSTGFLCNLPHRKSFCPDAAYYTGPRPANRMKFLPEPPAFAVEVRSENDYGPNAEREMREKRADYFAAGTQVVWDVDPVAQKVAVYRASDPDQPVVYQRGQEAEAEPAVPGWKLAVDRIFE